MVETDTLTSWSHEQAVGVLVLSSLMRCKDYFLGEMGLRPEQQPYGLAQFFVVAIEFGN